MSDTGGTSPSAEDAERMRLKRLAKLQGSGPPPQPAASTSSSPKPSAASTAPKTRPVAVNQSINTSSTPTSPPQRRPQAPRNLDVEQWTDDCLTQTLKVTLEKTRAEATGHDLVWLRSVANDILSENPVPANSRPLRLSIDMAETLLVARLELDPSLASETEDLELLPVLVSLPSNQSVLRYLIGSWKRLHAWRTGLLKQNYSQPGLSQALVNADRLRDLIISYAGLSMQSLSMFPEPPGRVTLCPFSRDPSNSPYSHNSSPVDLAPSLLYSHSLASPLTSDDHSANTSSMLLPPALVEPFFTDLARRFENDGLEEIVGPLFRYLFFNPTLQRPEGLNAGDATWRSVVGGLEALVNIRPIASLLPRISEWNPRGTHASNVEHVSLLGPISRLGIFAREWPAVGNAYYSEPDKRTRADVDSSHSSLRATMRNLQTALFGILNSVVRASPEAREGVLGYLAHVINLNIKRGGMQVDPATVASDGFLLNLQTSLLRFAEPFMDAKFSKIDRIDTAYLAHSTRLDIRDETRINATSDEAAQYLKDGMSAGLPAPNFITEIFYLTVAMNHYGPLRILQSYDELGKNLDEVQRQLDQVQSDPSWQGTPMQAQVEASIQRSKGDMNKIHTEMLAYQAQLLEPEFISRQIALTSFLATWLIRIVDPKHLHPLERIELPLPRNVPMSLRMLPEYFIEDVVEYYLFLVRNSPESLDLSGKNELVEFALTFLSSTWYIKNPYLKNKLVTILFWGTLSYRNDRNGVLGNLLNSHPLALKHLISVLLSYYIEAEQTGSHSQFYDKFDIRRNIAYLLRATWKTPAHRDALKKDALDQEKFIRLVNLMMNDVTFLLDESLTKLAEIASIEKEMESPEWGSQNPPQRRQRQGALRSAEQQATSYTTLGKSTLQLLRDFTDETKAPFMAAEIVERLAAMLDYNLAALSGPRCSDLKVKYMDKYRFNPRELLSDILQVYLNLSEQSAFIQAVANDGRSYSKELFERAAGIARKRSLKTDAEMERLRLFVIKVEEARLTLAAEEELGDIPDEFLDPLMFTLMREPVILPSSRSVVDMSTIRAHLLSDAKDPFNRVPLKLEDVTPDAELKVRIDNFLADRRINRESLQADVDMKPMDTS